MYEQFFGLAEKPFSIQPDPSFLYWGRTHRLAYAMLEYGVLNHAGISVITGEVGCGKTTLIHRLLDQLADTHTVALLSNVQAGRGDLLSWVLMAYGQPFTDTSHVALFSQLQSYFISEYAKGRRIVLIIDEAQNLSMDMLEELRLLSNINAGKDQLLQLILVGQPQLKDVLNRPELLQLTQRVGSDFHLTPLSREEVHAYIETRLSIAGCRRRIFTERAIDLIAEQSRGVPRVINVIADTALVYAFSAEDLVVGVETVRNVVRDKKSYGVFGIAASGEGVAPLSVPDDASDEISYPEEDIAPEQERETVSYEARAPMADAAPLPIKTMSDLRAGTQNRYAEESSGYAVAEREPAPAPREEPAVAPAPPADEAPSQAVVTGVVVYSGDPRVSPEAAIRSAGERPVVFAPALQMPDAIAAARRLGAGVIDPPAKGMLTAGRARNAGYRQLKKIAPNLHYVQFIDAAAAIDPDWIGGAERFMERRPEVAVIEGRAQLSTGDNVLFPTLAEQRKNETPGEIVRLAGAAARSCARTLKPPAGFAAIFSPASLTICASVSASAAPISGALKATC
ncbi:MAG: AAA family ATPase [Parvularculaceae bacterium]